MTYLWAACATHRRVPVSLLERFPRGEQVPAVLARLHGLPGVEGALVLSTCNRYEIYLSTDRSLSRTELAELVATTAGVDLETVGPALEVHTGDEVVHHLFSVSAGLDSRAPGEGEILGQLRTAAQTAAYAGSLDRELATLVQWAVRAGRRARRTAGAPVGRSSVGGAGVRLARQHLGSLQGRSVLVVGAGRVAGQSVRRLAQEGARAVLVARDPARAAERFPAHQVVSFPLSPELLAEVDAVICAASAPRAILTGSTLAAACAQRRGQPLVVIDLAVPRNVDPAAARVPALTLLDLDALPTHSREALSSGFDAARRKVREETSAYLSSRAARQAGDLLAAVTAHAEEVRQHELARVHGRVSCDEAALLDRVTHRLVGTLLHPALVGLRELAATGDLAAARRATTLLGAPTPDIATRPRVAG